MDMDAIFAELHKVGFSPNEAKAYVGLLRRSPVTGYEVSKRAGVPRTAIYEVLGKLVDRAAVYTVPADPPLYAPVPARDLLARLRRQADDTFGFLDTALGAIERAPEAEVIRRVRGQDAVLAELVSVVARARAEVWLSLWAAHVPALVGAVREAQGRGVRVFSVLFDESSARLGRTFHHGYMPRGVVERRLDGHPHIAARDAEEVAIAEFVAAGSPWALTTRDPALVLIATEYIRHDIMLAAVTHEFGAARLDALWHADPDLTHVVTGRRPDAPPARDKGRRAASDP